LWVLVRDILLGAPAGRRHHQVGTFELVAALVWRAVAAIRAPGRMMLRAR